MMLRENSGLPEELWSQIIKYLTPVELFQLGVTNKVNFQAERIAIARKMLANCPTKYTIAAIENKAVFVLDESGKVRGYVDEALLFGENEGPCENEKEQGITSFDHLPRITQLYSGKSTLVFFIDEENEIWLYGRDPHAEIDKQFCFFDSKCNITTPTKLELSFKVKQVIYFGSHFFFLDTEGEVWYYGTYVADDNIKCIHKCSEENDIDHMVLSNDKLYFINNNNAWRCQLVPHLSVENQNANLFRKVGHFLSCDKSLNIPSECNLFPKVNPETLSEADFIKLVEAIDLVDSCIEIEKEVLDHFKKKYVFHTIQSCHLTLNELHELSMSGYQSDKPFEDVLSIILQMFEEENKSAQLAMLVDCQILDANDKLLSVSDCTKIFFDEAETEKKPSKSIYPLQGNESKYHVITAFMSIYDYLTDDIEKVIGTNQWENRKLRYKDFIKILIKLTENEIVNKKGLEKYIKDTRNMFESRSVMFIPVPTRSHNYSSLRDELLTSLGDNALLFDYLQKTANVFKTLFVHHLKADKIAYGLVKSVVSDYGTPVSLLNDAKEADYQKIIGRGSKI